MNKESKLLQLAKERFGGVSGCEEKLIRAIANGEAADFSRRVETERDSTEERWDGKAKLQADRIIWLCTNPKAMELIGHEGIFVKHAHIDGEFDLSYMTVSFSLCFENCEFSEEIKLKHTTIYAIHLRGCETRRILADGVIVKGEVLLCEGFKANGEVSLCNATIAGDLKCEKGRFINKGAKALSLRGGKVEGSILLGKGFEANGEVDLYNVTITGDLDCDNGQFINSSGIALDFSGGRVEGSVLLREGFVANGEVKLFNTTMGGDLECDKGRFINKGGISLNFTGGKTEGSVLLRDGFEAKGEVDLYNATIGKDIVCSKGQFINRCGTAIEAPGIKIGGSVLLNYGFEAEGSVNLYNAMIGEDLECGTGRFINKGAIAINAGGVKVMRSIFMNNGFEAEGEVYLLNGTIGDSLVCDNGQFMNPTKNALNGEGVKIGGNVELRDGFKAQGLVSLVGATIGGSFIWSGVSSVADVTLDIRSAKIGRLCDEQKSWPEREKLFVQGMTYDEIDDGAPMDAKARIDWLRRQTNENFRPQPYEQLAGVLRKAGHDDHAKKVLIAKNDDLRRFVDLPLLAKLKYWLLKWFIGYGYRCWRPLWYVLGIVILGALLFQVGHSKNLMEPSKEKALLSDGDSGRYKVETGYPKFNAIVYSLDVFVPLINLHQENQWQTKMGQGEVVLNIKWFKLYSSDLLCWYLWFQIISGWIITTLFVVGLSGLIKS